MSDVLTFFPRPPRGVIALLLTVIASLTTLTVVDKCTMTHTTTLHTELPARDIARAVPGSIVASARLVLPARDTLVVHDTITTTRVLTRTVTRWLASSSAASGTGSLPPPAAIPTGVTRTAHFRDSTFAGIIDGTVIAPPDPAPLGLTYRLTRPVFDPTITFLSATSHPLVMVSWHGEHVTLDHVTFTTNISRWIRYVDVTYHPTTRQTTLAATVGVHLRPSLDLLTSVAHPVALTPLGAPVLAVRKYF